MGHSPSHIVVPTLSHSVTSDEYAYAPPHIHQCSGASLPAGAHPDCKTQMAEMQVDGNGSPSFSASFGDSLCYQSPAFLQA